MSAHRRACSSFAANFAFAAASCALVVLSGAGVAAAPPDPPINKWVKISPLPGGPPSPRLGYEGACAWDERHGVVIRYGGHNQGGGGEQGSEIWTFEPSTAKWTLKETNLSPPGICCGQQNVFDPLAGRYVRFPAFSGSHGWQWFREIYLNDASAWTYDLGENRWRNMRPYPTPNPRPLRCAAWDSDHQVIVLFGGEGSSEGTLVYDPYTNAWTRMMPSREPAFRSGGNMAYDAARRLHVLFGAQFDDDRHTWGYDLVHNEWQDLAPPSLPPTNKNDAVLAFDAAAKKVLAIVKVSAGEGDDAKSRLETWTYDSAANAWKKMDPLREPDPSGNRARQLMYAPELGVAMLENATRPVGETEREQQIWVYRLTDRGDAAAKGLAAPAGVRIATTENGAVVSWSAVPNAAKYVVLRGAGERPWLVEFKPAAETAAGATEFRDSGLPRGTVHYYAVQAIDREGTAGKTSIKVRAQPPVVDGVAARVASAERVELSWKPLSSGDVVGYVVERAAVEVYTEDQLARLKAQTPPLEEPSVGAIHRVGEFRALTRGPISETKFVDTPVDLAKPHRVAGEPLYERKFGSDSLDETGRPYRFAVFAYRVRAVNKLGTAGGASPAVFTIPAAVENLFSREEGTSCRLKWSAAEGVAGYRVYRMDGRFNKDKISRLTPKPITETTFTDETAGKSTRRYYIVAVDALGQEGFPSAPAWFEREWKSFYQPFVGPWHQ
jgi:hypothetical protein